MLLDAATHQATFYIMNTSRNRNRWGVSAKAMAEGAPTIKGKPIGCGLGYMTDDHYPKGENMDVGHFTSYEIPSSYMTAKAKIEDDTVWDYLEAGDWGPVSVVILPYEANCSICGDSVLRDLDARGVFMHDHIIKGKAYAKIESFKFDRIDFVDDSAYPQAGLLDMGASAEDLSQAITLVASLYSNGGAPGSPLNPEGIRKNMVDKTPEELQEELEEKVNAIAELEEEFKTLEEENKTLKAAAAKPADDDDKDPDAEKVKERLAALEAQNTQQLIDACADARFTAGLVKDLEEERERIKDYPAAMLITLTADAGVMAEKLKANQKRAPKLRYDDDADDITDLEAAVKAARERLIPEHNHKMLMAQLGQMPQFGEVSS